MKTIFKNSKEAMAYAKAHPGTIIARHPAIRDAYYVKITKKEKILKNKSRFE